MYDHIRICSRHTLLSYVLITIFTTVFNYLSIQEGIGEVNILVLFNIWSIWNCLMNIFVHIHLSDGLDKIDKEIGGYLNNNWIWNIYRLLVYLTVGMISDSILTIIDALYYNSIYQPIIGITIISVFKYVWHLSAILTTLVLIYDIKSDIKPILSTNLV